MTHTKLKGLELKLYLQMSKHVNGNDFAQARHVFVGMSSPLRPRYRPSKRIMDLGLGL